MNDFGLYLVMTNPAVGYAKCAEAAVRAGVGIVQLRMKHASRDEVLRFVPCMSQATCQTCQVTHPCQRLLMQFAAKLQC